MMRLRHAGSSIEARKEDFMYVVSRYGGWGRNLWACLDDGTIAIDDRKEHLRLRVLNGLVVEKTTQTKDEHTTMRYGRHRKTRKGNKTVSEEYFEPGTLRAIRRGGLWKKETGVPLCGSEGTLECYSSSGGAYGKEVFKYANGNIVLQRYLRCNNTLHLPGNAFIAFGLTADKKPARLALGAILLVAGKAQNASFDSPKCHHSQI